MNLPKSKTAQLAELTETNEKLARRVEFLEHEVARHKGVDVKIVRLGPTVMQTTPEEVARAMRGSLQWSSDRRVGW